MKRLIYKRCLYKCILHLTEMKRASKTKRLCWERNKKLIEFKKKNLDLLFIYLSSRKQCSWYLTSAIDLNCLPFNVLFFHSLTHARRTLILRWVSAFLCLVLFTFFSWTHYRQKKITKSLHCIGLAHTVIIKTLFSCWTTKHYLYWFEIKCICTVTLGNLVFMM